MWLNLAWAICMFLLMGIEEEAAPVPLPGMLYPRESESREVKSLDGLWEFLAAPAHDPQLGHREAWFAGELKKHGKVMQMPVPSSYNDITTSRELRDHVGVVWYERTFFVPPYWQYERVFLRFGSVNYIAQVWINGQLAMSHELGHLPFEAEISTFLKFNERNRVTVAVDNQLLPTSVPQGKIINSENDNGSVKIQTYTFDFFNYAGIHRPVLLHTKPNVYIDDIDVKTAFTNNTGIVKYNIRVEKENEIISYRIDLLDADQNSVLKEPRNNSYGSMKIHYPKLWWPHSMSDNPAYLYTLEVVIEAYNNTRPDIYRLPIGIRSVKWTSTSLLLNNEPIYLRGFGKHEDSAIRGKGLDLPTMVRDYELLKWVGANAYRTSHYPYSDEVLDMADRQGFLIIDECPSVDTDNFNPSLLKKHKDSLSELIRRDKNRPSVIMWSIANEPRTQTHEAGDYFKQVAQHTKKLDPNRPITISIARNVDDDQVGQYLDIISFNRYNGWYMNSGRLDMITNRVISEAESWFNKYKKPVIMSEYGADTMPGLHELPEYVWSEEYQMEIMEKHFIAFDQLRKKRFFIGEFIWNFADFRTAQTYTRVGGNKKGIFTRDRQPKMVAQYVRKRYHLLSAELDRTTPPNDLENYTCS